MGGMYWSAKLLVRGPPATGRASSPLARHRLSRVVAARVSSLLACRRCSRVVASRVSSSLSRRPRLRVILLLCVETERLPAWGERPR
ncbi:hypothetical protein BHE74_00051447 [Ensete ventricosum]|nr:hypothetical protein BHE74_00051447 [Ensete ventricosum]